MNKASRSGTSHLLKSLYFVAAHYVVVHQEQQNQHACLSEWPRMQPRLKFSAAVDPHILRRTAEMPGTRPWYSLAAPRPPGGAASQAATAAPARRSAAAQ